MSLLSGLLSGGSLIPAALGAAIDDSHNPFKRSRARPGAIGGKKDEFRGDWECANSGRTKLKSGAPAYSQMCQNMATGRTKIVKIGVAYKKKYNKKYRKAGYPKKHGGRFAKDRKRPGYVYKTPSPKVRASSKKK